jgi:hypothetical protein
MEPLSKVLIILMLRSRGCLVDHDGKFKGRCELPASPERFEELVECLKESRKNTSRNANNILIYFTSGRASGCSNA